MKSATPYYAVIFTSTRNKDDQGYAEMAIKMEALAREQPGFIDFESARSDMGITVSYWRDLVAIAAWKSNLEHQLAQRRGRQQWYDWYKVRICLVEREYEFQKNSTE